MKQLTKKLGRGCKNPAVSASQYGMAQAVLSGNSDAMPKWAAREIVDKTSKGMRSKFAKELAKVRKGRKNPSDYFDNDTENENDTESKAAELSRRFHGRANETVSEIDELETYIENLAELGDLIELEVMVNEDEIVPISFSYDNDKKIVSVCCTPDGKNLEFVGGDQDLGDLSDLTKQGITLEYEENTGKRLVDIGEVFSISYYTDKHHLEGPKSQANGEEYIHEFGEQGGIRPRLVYDTLNKKISLVGGSYEVREEGIWD